MPKKVAILQSNYIPWKGYFDLINMVDEFIIYDSVQFTKNDWRNRNKIKTGAGLKWLTIPVRHKYLGQKINETEVSDHRWKKKHWESIKMNYSRAPFFHAYSDLLEKTFLNCSYHQLSEINLYFLNIACKILSIETKIISDKEFRLTGSDPTERLIEILKQSDAAIYLSGPSAKNYLKEGLFEREQIKIEWIDYSGYKEYHQQYPPFEHKVSIIDLILNEGPDSHKYFKSFRQE